MRMFKKIMDYIKSKILKICSSILIFISASYFPRILIDLNRINK